MSAEATTATPPATNAITQSASVAPPPAAAPTPDPAMVPASDFAAYQADTRKQIAELQAQVAASAPKPAPSEYTSHVYLNAVREFGEDADPALVQTFVDHTQAMNALDYQISMATDPSKRAELQKELRLRRGRQASARASILVVQREAQRKRQARQEEATPTEKPAHAAPVAIPLSMLQDQAQIMPALEESTPLLAAQIRSGAIKYADLVARIADPDNNPAAQWNSIMLTTETQLATGAYVAPTPPANGAPLPDGPAPGMPLATGGQSGVPSPATTDAERRAADAAAIARMRAEKGQ